MRDLGRIGKTGGAFALSDRPIATVLLLGLIALPWIAWYVLRRLWLRRRERLMLQAKYGDLEMFAKRLREWKVVR